MHLNRFHSVFIKEEVTHSRLFSFHFIFGGFFGVCLHLPSIASDSIWQMMNEADHLGRDVQADKHISTVCVRTFSDK